MIECPDAAGRRAGIADRFGGSRWPVKNPPNIAKMEVGE
jgi:hypothetical protein